jgi:diguanylate cyclase (GGDEF)-like protein
LIAQLGELQRTRLEHGDAENDAVLDLAESYALVRESYARTLALPAASLRSKGASVVRRLGEVFDQSLLPHTNAIVWAREQSIRREISRLDRWAQGIFALTIGAAAFALLLSLGTPYVTHRIVVRPVVDLVDAVSNFRAGDRDARPRLRPRSELGQLASSLNGLLDELEQSHEKVRALALFDGTTGLPNRQYFQERLAGALVKARLHKRAMGLLAVNMAGLKQVNETLGIAAGDDLIRQASKRLRECVRLTDVVSRPTQDEFKTEVSHLGGDEFTILLSKVSQATDPAFVAQRVLSLLAEPFRVEDRDIALSLSIGIGVYPQDGTDADTLLRNASAAMNQAREGGGSCYQFYSEAMNVANSRKLHIQGRLSGALERGDLALHFQPIRDAQYGHLTGAEALLRWTDSEMGPVGPDEFMAIAESAGLVSQIGSWVLHSACDQLRVWRKAGYPPIRMSVNVSATQLQDDDWVETVADALRSSGANPECLELEITETSILQEGPSTLATLTSISEMGVGIVLDDFGTGYSSLSNLRSLPIGRVKVDRSFVSEIAEDGEGGAIAAAVIALALSLDLEVVAEGVETHGQANFLRSKGCTELQGYLISRPLAASEFERFMDRQKQESEEFPLEV